MRGALQFDLQFLHLTLQIIHLSLNILQVIFIILFLWLWSNLNILFMEHNLKRMVQSLILKSSLLLSNLEPEPVEDLNAGDDGEASEEAHHAAHPGDLVRDGHPGVLGDLDRS